MGVRAAFATAVGRLTHWGLRTLLHRSASQLPGRIALALDQNLIAELASKIERGAIVVCGTNGKTTTNNIVARALEAAGNTVLCNRDGANMAAGVTSALLPKSSADWAVIEADELSTIKILPQLQPDYLVLLNLFRDQLDRAGEIDRVQDTIVKALSSSPHTTLIVCGDDPLCMGVALRAQQHGTHILSFGIGEDLHLPKDRVPEARFCQVCGEELHYDYRSYAQLGKFWCPNGDFSRPSLNFVADEIKVGRNSVALSISGPSMPHKVRLSAEFGGLYMVYNLLAVCAAASTAGVDASQLQQVLDNYHPQNGRLQRFVVDGREVILNLAKNPTGFNQNISLLAQDTRQKAAFIVINDNFNDGKDISWIWDVDFERFLLEHDIRVIAGGHRAHDVQVRLKYAGIDARLAENVEEALRICGDLDVGRPLYVLTNYSALWGAKAELERLGKRA